MSLLSGIATHFGFPAPLLLFIPALAIYLSVVLFFTVNGRGQRFSVTEALKGFIGGAALAAGLLLMLGVTLASDDSSRDC